MQLTSTTIQAANGAEFTIVRVGDYQARIAHNVRPVTATDGTVWMAAAGFGGRPIAWRTDVFNVFWSDAVTYGNSGQAEIAGKDEALKFADDKFDEGYRVFTDIS